MTLFFEFRTKEFDGPDRRALLVIQSGVSAAPLLSGSMLLATVAALAVGAALRLRRRRWRDPLSPA